MRWANKALDPFWCAGDICFALSVSGLQPVIAGSAFSRYVCVGSISLNLTIDAVLARVLLPRRCALHYGIKLFLSEPWGFPSICLHMIVALFEVVLLTQFLFCLQQYVMLAWDGRKQSWDFPMSLHRICKQVDFSNKAGDRISFFPFYGECSLQ